MKEGRKERRKERRKEGRSLGEKKTSTDCWAVFLAIGTMQYKGTMEEKKN